MTTSVKLTEAQRRYLEACAKEPRSPLDVPCRDRYYAVDALERMGLIERTSMYIATPAGREWLESEGGDK